MFIVYSILALIMSLIISVGVYVVVEKVFKKSVHFLYYLIMPISAIIRCIMFSHDSTLGIILKETFLVGLVIFLILLNIKCIRAHFSRVRGQTSVIMNEIKQIKIKKDNKEKDEV